MMITNHINQYLIQISIHQQTLRLLAGDECVKKYLISTAKNGAGEQKGSEKTPRGKHMIRAKIGEGLPINTIFVGRRPTGEIYHSDMKIQYPNRDWILTRILWLSGLEVGKNRLGQVDTMRRYIYIHGTPSDNPMGLPESRGCIRMQNEDILELCQMINAGTRVNIE